MHRSFIRRYGKWAPAMVPHASDFESMDEAQHRSVSVVTGGTVEPSSPIVLGGFGTTFSSSGNILRGSPAVGNGYARFAVPPTFAAPQTRTTRMSLARAAASHRFQSDKHGPRDSYAMPIAKMVVSPVVGLRVEKDFGGVAITAHVKPEYLHDGATLSSVRVAWIASDMGEFVPQVLPTLSVLRGRDMNWDYNPAALWVASQAVSVGTVRFVSVNDANRAYGKMTCVTAGTTGTQVPILPRAEGGLVNDGTAVWTTTRWYSTTPSFQHVDMWSAARTVVVGEYVRVVERSEYYRSTVAGTTGMTAPAWNGATVVDGSVTWQLVGSTGTARRTTSLQEYRNASKSTVPRPQWLEVTLDRSNVIDMSDTWYVHILDASGTYARSGNVYLFAEFNFTNITDLRMA